MMRLKNYSIRILFVILIQFNWFFELSKFFVFPCIYLNTSIFKFKFNLRCIIYQFFKQVWGNPWTPAPVDSLKLLINYTNCREVYPISELARTSSITGIFSVGGASWTLDLYETRSTPLTPFFLKDRREEKIFLLFTQISWNKCLEMTWKTLLSPDLDLLALARNWIRLRSG